MTLNRISPGTLFIFAFCIIMVIGPGCSKKKQIRGKDIVPREVMVDMMVDMHLVDGLTNDVSYYRKFNPRDSIDLYGAVYQKYGIDKEEFYTTLMEYASEPRLLDKLYGDVLKELNLMQEELDRQHQEELDKRRVKKQTIDKSELMIKE